MRVLAVFWGAAHHSPEAVGKVCETSKKNYHPGGKKGA
jgi:hypothetical protein